MKKAITEEREICDFCHVNQAPYWRCMSCNKAMCYECEKIHAKEYPHAVYFGGSEDGRYCRECDVRLIADRSDKLHRAYRRVEALRAESVAWSDEFKLRSNAAEVDVKNYLKDFKANRGVKP